MNMDTVFCVIMFIICILVTIFYDLYVEMMNIPAIDAAYIIGICVGMTVMSVFNIIVHNYT